MVMGSSSISLLRPEELELLVCGTPHLDLHELEHELIADLLLVEALLEQLQGDLRGLRFGALSDGRHVLRFGG